jgi:hypothetical protein
MKRGKMAYKILSKVFRGVQGGGFSKKPPWPPEAKRRKKRDR